MASVTITGDDQMKFDKDLIEVPADSRVELTLEHVCGVSEETCFRDDMQGGLEKRLGAAPAMAVTSLPVWFAHLDHADGAARWALLLGMSAMRGALT